MSIDIKPPNKSRHLKRESNMKVINITAQRRTKKKNDITYNKTVNFDGAVLPIQNRDDWGSYRPALRSIHTQLKNMLSHHCKLLALRTDFHVNSEQWTEGDFSIFLKRSKRQLCKHYQLKRIAHVWARESSKNGSHHYHLVLILDGNKVNHPIVVTNILTQEWVKLGHSHPRRNNHHILVSSVDDKFLDAFFHFSYLAKIHTKDQQPSGTRNFGSSQVRMNNKKLIKVA